MASSVASCPPFGFSGKYYHLSGDGGSCVRQSSFFEGKAVLNQGVGYSVILGFGAFFAFFTSFLVWLEKRYVGSRHTSEWFNTAGRNVKTGLIASVIVSQFTMLSLFSVVANLDFNTSFVPEVDLGCYNLTKFQCCVGVWRQWSILVCKWRDHSGMSKPIFHLFPLFFSSLSSNAEKTLSEFNTSSAYGQVLLFGVMAIEIKRKAPNAHTVCEIVKARWPFQICGIFMCGVLPSLISVHVVLVIFVYLVYTASNELGSPGVVYQRLLEVSSKSRVCQEPLSHDGQSCGPVSGNYKGSYLTMLSSGGLVFGIINIVGNFGTVFVDNGYWVSAIAARPSSTHKGYLLGGLVWAVTSAGSSELIAVSSLCTYDIYRTYINPNATGKQILKVSRSVVLGFGCFMGILAVILNKAGVSLGWMYLAMGVLIGSAVLPIAFMLLWRKANAIGAILGVTTGCVLGITTWLAVASIEYGRVNLDTTGRNAPMLAGNLVSILTGGAVHAVCSFWRPQNYDWDTTKQITMVEKEKSELPVEELREEKLIRAKAWIVKWGVGFTFVIAILWPLLSLPAGQFSKGYFTFWAVIAIAWGTVGSAVIIALPLMESWKTIQSVLLGMFTNDRLLEKVEELNLKLHTIMLAIPEAERIYLLEKEKAKKNNVSQKDSISVSA
ncbi:hypothetical protein RJ639_038025 [Escallonia herrerae]|uniref:Urea-proton symporter DUR3 n=1 Tax=Escallonia herrerae TaxID=1293975 RepID=A0AA88WM42_9ASTE|nr:hypothetical protein RJ639_038025 [Escallonia herrerae]